ncbi:hypothetical protein KKE60_08570 [Patescibacteria group bacterium]|nr:hypothetical protein [Patescibacteria group bacterium]
MADSKISALPAVGGTPAGTDNLAITNAGVTKKVTVNEIMALTPAVAHAATTGQTVDDHHAEAHSVASHNDTSGTGAELDTLTDGSNADALHVHTAAGVSVTHASTTGQGTDDHHAQAHTIASHSDTTGTGPELDTLTDGSNADALHVHTAAGVSVTHASTTGQTANDHHAESHTIASHSDTTGTGAELDTLTDGSNADALHVHAGLDFDGVFGDASDGTVVIGADTQLTRDMFYDDLTVSNGFYLAPRGRRIFVAGTLTVAAGGFITTQGADGGNGGNAVGLMRGGGGTVGAVSAQTTDYSDNTIPGGLDGKIGSDGGSGGVGGNPGGAGTVGTAGFDVNDSVGSDGSSGGAGGAGGDANIAAGGAGGGIGAGGVRTLLDTTAGGVWNFINLTLWRAFTAAAIKFFLGSAGAGSGGGGGGGGGMIADTGGGGGGGGASGGSAGSILICAKDVVLNGDILTNGGDGGDGGDGADGVSGGAEAGGGGGGAGGAGGSGGIVVIFYNTWTGAGTTSVAGGAAGAAGAAGAGAGGGVGGTVGAVGTAGPAGKIYLQQLG